MAPGMASPRKTHSKQVGVGHAEVWQVRYCTEVVRTKRNKRNLKGSASSRLPPRPTNMRFFHVGRSWWSKTLSSHPHDLWHGARASMRSVRSFGVFEIHQPDGVLIETDNPLY